MAVAVALVEPQYYVNVGHIARLMKNFGVKRLYLVKPHYDKEEAVRYATHGKDVLLSAKVVTLKQLRSRFDILAGTTAIRAISRLNVLRESIDPERLAQIVLDAENKNVCLVLGRESSGLTNKELEMCDLVVTIDTKTKYRTMNVAHALALLLYEISKAQPKIKEKQTKKKIDLASQRDIKLLLRYARQLAKACNYDAHKKPLLDSSVKKILAKSVPSTKDVMLLISLFRKSLLAIERGKNEG
jgi:TrmH family RNA methyltransferase